MAQALWNEVGLRLSPKKRVFVPAGLFTGLREEHTLKELARLYSQVRDRPELRKALSLPRSRN